MSSSIVLIAPAAAIVSLRERLSSGAALTTFSDEDVTRALDHIIHNAPTIVAVEEGFSSTARGIALIDRIKDDPQLTGCDLRIIAHDVATNRFSMRRTPRIAAVTVRPDESPRALDPAGTRRVPRERIEAGVEVLVDGNAASLLELSATGIMVISAKMLKPHQRVRLGFVDVEGTIRCIGAVVWATVEMSKAGAPAYKAGIELSGADVAALVAFAERHQHSDS